MCLKLRQLEQLCYYGTQTFPLDDVPFELLLLILSYIEKGILLSTLVKLRLVSKKLNILIEKAYPYLLQSNQIEIIDLPKPKKTELIMENFSKYLSKKAKKGRPYESPWDPIPVVELCYRDRHIQSTVSKRYPDGHSAHLYSIYRIVMELPPMRYSN